MKKRDRFIKPKGDTENDKTQALILFLGRVIDNSGSEIKSKKLTIISHIKLPDELMDKVEKIWYVPVIVKDDGVEFIIKPECFKTNILKGRSINLVNRIDYDGRIIVAAVEIKSSEYDSFMELYTHSYKSNIIDFVGDIVVNHLYLDLENPKGYFETNPNYRDINMVEDLNIFENMIIKNSYNRKNSIEKELQDKKVVSLFGEEK